MQDIGKDPHGRSKPVVVVGEFRRELERCHEALQDSGRRGGILYGGVPQGVREDLVRSFQGGDLEYLCVHPAAAGHGLTLTSPADMIFLSHGYSYEQYYQAVRRCWRFGQTRPVDVHLVSANTEGAVKKNLERKQAQAEELTESMLIHVRELAKKQIVGATMEKAEYNRESSAGDGWTMHLRDCVDVVSEFESECIDYTVFSPPFASLYTYSNSDRDMGNCADQDEFMGQFKFLVDDLAGQLMTDELFFLQRIADENKEVKPLDITQAILDEWKQMATDDGNADEYQYHIGMVYPPLPYKLWKLKKEALDRIQARDDYQAGLDLPQGVEHRADELVKELGY